MELTDEYFKNRARELTEKSFAYRTTDTAS